MKYSESKLKKMTKAELVEYVNGLNIDWTKTEWDEETAPKSFLVAMARDLQEEAEKGVEEVEETKVEEVVEETKEEVVETKTETKKGRGPMSEEAKAKLRESMVKAFADETKRTNLRNGIHAYWAKVKAEKEAAKAKEPVAA